MPMRCAIVGAGCSGLASARWAKAYDIEPVVFEASQSVGGLWCYKENVDECKLHISLTNPL
ncbi:flavin-containing monooxygenase FMO GS-OX3-like protein [Aphelenchoides avenae]|nr:flavin-containing monooxygenase FMO GS-OX3-like protein [Aphelenchus avenae]